MRRPAGRLLGVRETDRKSSKRQPTTDTSRYRTTLSFTHRHTSDLLSSSSADLTPLIKELINLSKKSGNFEPTISTGEIQPLAHAAILPNGSSHPFESRF